MRRFRKLMVGAISALSLVAAGSATVLAHDDGSVLRFDSMIGVHGAGVGTVNHRGITGGGLPWVIASGRGEVSMNGEVEVRVKGLVIPVPPFNGTNPVPMFGATVSCVTQNHVIVNVSTGLFPADTAGNSTIKDKVTLPSVCRKPILFVTSPGGAWFAKSTSEDEEDGD
jgi:hypothetical protein